jgi:ribose transport system ATP-binding protein
VRPEEGVAGEGRDGMAEPVPVDQPILEITGVSKAFNQVPALRDVDLTVARGEVHGVVGQNGAGKSTLMKILNGVYTKDSGQVRIDGKEVEYDTPLGARENGISMVFQEFSLVPTLTIAQNVFLTREPRRNGVLLDDAYCQRRTAAILEELGVALDPKALVQDLSVGSRQLVEIAKALSQEPRILILDEPTASLSANETETLFAVIRRLKALGISLVYISHHLQDLLRISDRITVLRDGRRILTRIIKEVQLHEVIQAMLGASLETQEAAGRAIDRTGPPLLQVDGLRAGQRVVDVSFAVWPGEVLGIAGLLGSGRTELIRAIFGIDRVDGGVILVRGRPVAIKDTAGAVALGMSLVPEDRRSQGLVLEHTVKENLLLPIWKRLDRFGLIDDAKADDVARRTVRTLSVKTSGLGQVVKFLSGGNQQKVVVGKSLSSQPSILLLDEATFGIDIRSKQEILAKVREFADAGNAVVFVDSEWAQLAAVCDRVLVLHRGRIVDEFSQTAGQEITDGVLHRAVQHAGAGQGVGA